jgi:DNA (cytosine-5)-methyltransferase 1
VTQQVAISAPVQVPTAEPEVYLIERGRLIRRVARRDGQTIDTDFGSAPATEKDLAKVAEGRLLRLKGLPPVQLAHEFTAADLFCGAGALSAGFLEAARALGAAGTLTLAADNAKDPLAVYAASLPCDRGATRCVDLASVLDGDLGTLPTEAERAFLREVPHGIDICLAGPPCQGHSTLNNHTRHDDDRNDLYLRVVRFVELRAPRFCFIENVQSVERDQRQSVERATKHLRALGYTVDQAVVKLRELGVPQSRQRHVVAASRRGELGVDLDAAVKCHTVREPRTVRWAIEDLLATDGDNFDAASVPSPENADRMAWLHRSGARDLPNSLRPKCHREPKRLQNGSLKEHTYKSMYGRLAWDEPAQTITSGYGSMGQGRYVHPQRQRTLTPHEAARLQLFPDYFDFSPVRTRGSWAKMIGNAAPMKLSYVLSLEALR